MLHSYTVCAYCFEKLERGRRCHCSTAQRSEQKIAVRYGDTADMQLDDYNPNILGQEITALEVPPVGVEVTVAPWVVLEGDDLERFQELVDEMIEVIDKSLEDNE